MPIGVRAFAGAGAGLHDPHHQVDRKLGGTLLQREHDRVAIRRLHRRDDPVTGRPAAERRVEEAVEGVRHVLGRQLAAIVELHSVAKADHVGELVGFDLQRLGEVGHRLQLIVNPQQRVVEQLVGLLRGLVRPDPRIEVDGSVGHPHDDHPVDRPTLTAAQTQREGGERRRGDQDGPGGAMRAPAGRVHSAWLRSSASSVSACIGVRWLTSTARSRTRIGSSSIAGAWNNPSC